LIKSSNEQQARLQELQSEKTNLQQQISESQNRIRALEEALRGARSRHESELASLRADYEREIAQREREINDLKANATTQLSVPAPAAADAPKPAIIERKFDPTGPAILIGAAVLAFFIIRSLWQGFAISRSESVGSTGDEEEKEVQSAAPVQATPPTDPSYLMLKSLGAIS
jgi:F0F1-type ATP synthase membrane subunit b/b'